MIKTIHWVSWVTKETGSEEKAIFLKTNNRNSVISYVPFTNHVLHLNLP
jgi:hypothetical protein